LSSEEIAALKQVNMKTLTGTSFLLIGFFFMFDSWGIIGYFGALGIPAEIFWPVSFVVIGVYSFRKQLKSTAFAYSQKKFYRIKSFKRFKGVCSGLAMYLNTDSNLIRMTWIVFTFITLGLGIVIYFIIVLMVPYYNEA
jgi:phage shock protein PspC (stress-responsive transcriptional regulator)